MFDQSSPNGILLFREASKIIVAFGTRILQQPVQNDVYKEKYKGISISLNVLTCALSGNYVNFGVFALYNDPVSDGTQQNWSKAMKLLRRTRSEGVVLLW